MGKVRRVIRNNGREFGEIEEDVYGRKIVRNVHGEISGEIEEDAGGQEFVVKYEGDKKQEFGKIEFDPYRNKEVIRRNDEKEDEEIEYEREGNDSGSVLDILIESFLAGYHMWDSWDRKKDDKKYQVKQTKKQNNYKQPPKPGPGERLREI